MNIHLALLIGYSVALVALGLWISRLVRGSADFFVAGRSLGAPLLFSTVLAANIGAGTTIGAAGVGYRDGISAWWWNGAAAIGSIFLALWVGPAIWRLASKHNLYTAGDYLELRYGKAVRGIIAALIWFGTLVNPGGTTDRRRRDPDRRRRRAAHGGDRRQRGGDDRLLHGRRPARLGVGQRACSWR